MEGPSLFLAQQQLRPFRGKVIRAARGAASSIDAAELTGLEVRDIFAWGKHLVFQFDTFALRFHFLMFGTFEAKVGGEWVTGDYHRTRKPKLSLSLEGGQFKAFSCSIRVIESRRARADYDFGIDIMSRAWDEARVRKLLRSNDDAEIADVLLDQRIFAGVGNIIKNEVLAITHIAPTRTVASLSPAKQREIVRETRAFSRQFYLWRVGQTSSYASQAHLPDLRRASCESEDGQVAAVELLVSARPALNDARIASRELISFVWRSLVA